VKSITTALLDILTGFITFQNSATTRQPDIKTRIIQVKTIFDIGKLTPKYTPGFAMSNRLFDIDKNGNFFFLESLKHRVLKFSPTGKFITQVGSIGQDDPGLYFPTAIKISGDTLYISDYYGRKLKCFSLDGGFKSVFNIPNSVSANYIDVDKDKIYVNSRVKSVKEFNHSHLISVYDEKGNKVTEFGQIIECQNIYGYLVFNTGYFSIAGGYLIGAFSNSPVIFKYDLAGKQSFSKDIVSMKAHEFVLLENESKRPGFDTPQKIRGDTGQVDTIRFCSGFDVDDNLHAYYSVFIEKVEPCIYHFDANGDILERLILKSSNRTIKVKHIHIDKNTNKKYGIGFLNGSGGKEDAMLFEY